MPFQIVLANPRGFCAGVNRAIAIVHQALERYQPPVYVLHEIVHNTHVIEELRQLGAVFVEELDEVPDGAPVVFSAHGVPKSVPAEATVRGLRVHVRSWIASKLARDFSLVSARHQESITVRRGGADWRKQVLSADLPKLERATVRGRARPAGDDGQRVRTGRGDGGNVGREAADATGVAGIERQHACGRGIAFVGDIVRAAGETVDHLDRPTQRRRDEDGGNGEVFVVIDGHRPRSIGLRQSGW